MTDQRDLFWFPCKCGKEIGVPIDAVGNSARCPNCDRRWVKTYLGGWVPAKHADAQVRDERCTQPEGPTSSSDCAADDCADTNRRKDSSRCWADFNGEKCLLPERHGGPHLVMTDNNKHQIVWDGCGWAGVRDVADDKKQDMRSALIAMLARFDAGCESNTIEAILADYLLTMLAGWNKAAKAKTDWLGGRLR